MDQNYNLLELTMMNMVNTDFFFIQVWCTNQIYIKFNFECLTPEIEDNVNLKLMI